MKKNLMESTSSGTLQLGIQKRLFQKHAVFIRRAPDLDEVVAGKLYCCYQVQNEFGGIVFFYSGEVADAFEEARRDHYHPFWVH